MLNKLLRSSALLTVAAMLAVGAAPRLADAALTAEQSAALAEAEQGGSEALATELAVQVLADPSAWEDLLAQALAHDPDSATLYAATLAYLMPLQAAEIAEATCGDEDPLVSAAVATAVPAASAEVESTICGPFGSQDANAVAGTVNLAENISEDGKQLAKAGTFEKESDLQNDSSSLQDTGTPSPN